MTPLSLVAWAGAALIAVLILAIAAMVVAQVYIKLSKEIRDARPPISTPSVVTLTWGSGGSEEPGPSPGGSARKLRR